MSEVFICDAVRTPFGRYGGALASIRTDDLATLPIKALMERNPAVDWDAVDDVIYGCVNQAGEDNRNLARLALLLAGVPQPVPAPRVKPWRPRTTRPCAARARGATAGRTRELVPA